ncbi:MAG: methionine aminotransferase [Candidatus Cyclobacteriaceae bacterium M2_1C_046]
MSHKSKLPDVETSIFTVMSKMANEEGAINLSQGFPDFPVDERLIDLIYSKMQEGHNQYAPMPGVPALLKSISKMIDGRHNYAPDPLTEMVVTSGATEALFATFQALIHKGDEVIVFDPAYDSYDPAIRLNGGKPVHIPLRQPDFKIDWDQVDKKISSKTRAIIINTPHNPTGAVLEEEDIKRLEKIVEEKNIIVISDEVYEWIIFDYKPHLSILKSEVLRNNGVAIYSFGKTFHATGWKVGYAVAPEFLMKEIKKMHQFITFSVNTPVQTAFAEFITDPENYEYLPGAFQEKRDFFIEKLKDSRFQVVPCSGTYFQLLSFKNISDKPDVEMAEWLTKEHKVASIPISVFYQDRQDNQMLRFCFAKEKDTLEKAAEILCKI